jgi:hypothetical protein
VVYHTTEYPGEDTVRVSFTYDNDGNILTELTEYWDDTHWGTDWLARTTYTYDGNGNRLMALSEFWSAAQWRNGSRRTYTYDGSGNRLTEVIEHSYDSAWVAYSRYTYTYDGRGNRLTALSEFWSQDRTEWAFYDRTAYAYDGSGNTLSELNQYWVAQWLNRSRRTYTYDGSGNRLTAVVEGWDGSQWISGSRYAYVYDGDGNLRIFRAETWWEGAWVPAEGGFFFPILERTFQGYQIALHYTKVDTSIAIQLNSLPTSYQLHQNYPNPFNPTTTISCDLPQVADVTLTVYDVLGRQVRELASGTKPAGTYEVTFDAGGLPSGLYFYRLQAGSYVETKRMVIVR